jgi:hypothetical protein
MPTSEPKSVDLPVFGLPIKATVMVDSAIVAGILMLLSVG